MGDSRFKSGQVNLKKGSPVNQRIDHHAMRFLIIGGKMFQAGAGAGALHAFDEMDCHLAGLIRVFGIIFKIAAAKRVALDIHAGAKQHGNIFGATFKANGMAHFFNQTAIPA